MIDELESLILILESPDTDLYQKLPMYTFNSDNFMYMLCHILDALQFVKQSSGSDDEEQKAYIPEKDKRIETLINRCKKLLRNGYIDIFSADFLFHCYELDHDVDNTVWLRHHRFLELIEGLKIIHKCDSIECLSEIYKIDLSTFVNLTPTPYMLVLPNIQADSPYHQNIIQRIKERIERAKERLTYPNVRAEVIEQNKKKIEALQRQLILLPDDVVRNTELLTFYRTGQYQPRRGPPGPSLRLYNSTAIVNGLPNVDYTNLFNRMLKYKGSPPLTENKIFLNNKIFRYPYNVRTDKVLGRGVVGTSPDASARYVEEELSKLRTIETEIRSYIDKLESDNKDLIKAGKTFNTEIVHQLIDSKKINEHQTKYILDELLGFAPYTAIGYGSETRPAQLRRDALARRTSAPQLNQPERLPDRIPMPPNNPSNINPRRRQSMGGMYW